MNIESLRIICLSLPHTHEEIKWENDLCFLIANKMFCATNVDNPVSCSLKVLPDKFDELLEIDGVISAPYLGRYKWVLIDFDTSFSSESWKSMIRTSYDLVKEKIPRNVLKNLD